ncbi:YusW family protein [Cytobacillus gottheilii]|uniref:YusW family protein n=1 Tax=Cytobacillus gottheilii TaxID=859144 RepID=UPI0009BB4E8D|nr:YusW family protein [Cytobacillus gottheilii]
MVKKRILWIGIFLMLSLLLAACGDNDEVENPPQNTAEDEQQQTEENNATNDNNDTTGYNFTHFDLDADYQDHNDALEVDYENETNDQMEASYQDHSQDIDLNGDAAIEELDSIFSSFNFDENTPDEEVLTTISEAFSIPEDAQNIELEIQFSGGTEKEYRK